MSGPRRSAERGDGVAATRRAGAQDRDEHLYARKRARAARARAAAERRDFDPAPPDDDDWTTPDEDTDGVRRIAPPTPVVDTIGKLLRQRGWDERLRGATAWSRWPEIVGTEMAARCEPVRLAGGTLVVRAESSVWATQLRYLTGQLLSNAAEVLGPGTVRAVTIVVGPLEGRTEPEATGTP